jgi:hypothetical protein
LTVNPHCGKQYKSYLINTNFVLIVIASFIVLLILSLGFQYASALKPAVQITSVKSETIDVPNGGTVRISLSQTDAKVTFSYGGFDDNDHIRELRCSFDGISYLKSNCTSESSESRSTFIGPDGVSRTYYLKTGITNRDFPEGSNQYTFGVKVLNDNNELSPGAVWKFSVQKNIVIDPGIHVIEPREYKVTVQFDSITVHNNHDPFVAGDGEYWLWAIVQGQTVDLNEASAGKLWNTGDGQLIYFAPYAKATVTISEKLPLSIFTVGFEEDHCAPAGFGRGTYAPTVRKILEGPESEWISEIRKIIDGSNKYFLYDSCGVNPADRIGFINKIYYPPGRVDESIGFGVGKHTRVLSSNGAYPNSPNMPPDFTLRYTISVEPLPTN